MTQVNTNTVAAPAAWPAARMAFSTNIRPSVGWTTCLATLNNIPTIFFLLCYSCFLAHRQSHSIGSRESNAPAVSHATNTCVPPNETSGAFMKYIGTRLRHSPKH